MSALATDTGAQAEHPAETTEPRTKERSRFFAVLLAALHDARRREAARVIHRYRHLIPSVGQLADRTAVKDAANGSY